MTIGAIISFVIISLIVGYAGTFLVHFYTNQGDFELKKYPNFVSFLFLLCVSMIIYFSTIFFGLPYQIFFLSYSILMLLCVLGLIDIKCLAIPDSLNFLFLMMCIVYAFLYLHRDLSELLSRIFIGFGLGGIFFALKIFYQSLTHKDIIGEADIIVLSGLGVAFDVFFALLSVFVGSFIALLYVIILGVFKQTQIRDIKLPFVFFVFIGVLLVYITSPFWKFV